MATRTQSKTGTRGSNSRSRSSGASRGGSDKSAFSWGDSGAGLLGAAVAGAAIAVAANLGRKALMQGMVAAAGAWDEALAAEHDAALMLFDKILATDDSQTIKRTMLLKKLTHALDKHAHEEEHVIYPAMREMNQKADADQLEVEHGEVKTFLYELAQMPKDSPDWLPKVREFRTAVEAHARMEEEQLFPMLRAGMTEEQNAKITRLVNRDGFWMS